MKISKDYLRQLIKEELAEAEEGGKPAAGSVLGAGKNIAAARQHLKQLGTHASFAKMMELSGDPVGKIAVAEVLLGSVLGIDPKTMQQKKNIILSLIQ